MVTSRVWFTAEQKAELWERWKQGQSISSISRALERRNKRGVAIDVMANAADDFEDAVETVLTEPKRDDLRGGVGTNEAMRED